MSRSITIAASILFLGLASTGCTVDATSEEEPSAEQTGAVSERSESEETTDDEPSLAAPVRAYELSPDLDGQKEIQGPFPQPWTPGGK